MIFISFFSLPGGENLVAIDLIVQHVRAQLVAKGRLISKFPYEKSVSSKIPTKTFLDFCPEIFCSFLGASW